MIWGCRDQERLLRRWIALQIMFALSGALIVVYLLRGQDEDETAARADEWVRARQVAW